MQEFELISSFFRQADFAQPNSQIALGIGDDCAVLNLAAGQQLCVSTDSLVAGVHFPHPCDPFLLGQRALAVAVSDLAASAATPLGFTLALTMPKVDTSWLGEFVRGLALVAQRYDIRLLGGDTTQGPLNLGITVLGTVATGQALLRSTAKVGDWIGVTGELGAAAAALALFQQPKPVVSADIEQLLLQAFWQPEPQLAVGQWLAGKASAAIDISDGLLADAEHIANESGVQMAIEQQAVPVSAAAIAIAGEQARRLALTGGDDYQLLFTLAPKYWPQLQQSFPQVHKIGEVLPIDASSAAQLNHKAALGYQHFAEKDNG